MVAFFRVEPYAWPSARNGSSSHVLIMGLKGDVTLSGKLLLAFFHDKNIRLETLRKPV